MDQRGYGRTTGWEDKPYDQINDVRHRHRLNDCAHQINHDHETHTEATETTQLLQRNQFDQVVHSGVDPATTLRHEDGETIRGDGPGVCSHRVLCLVLGVELDKQRSQITIFSEMQQVLGVESVDAVLGVLVDDSVCDEQGTVRVRSATEDGTKASGPSGSAELRDEPWKRTEF